VANLGAAIAARGCNVCLIDLDPQAHLTLHFNIEPGPKTLSVYDILSGRAGFADACVKVDEHLTVVPSVIDLAAAEVELAGTVGREQILRDSMEAQPQPFQLVMIDCPPSLGLLTLNALAAADEVFIPLQPHFLALQGLGKLLETVSLVQRRINPGLRVGGVVLCLYETATRLAAEVVADMSGFFEANRGAKCAWANAHIFSNVIRRNVKLAECPSHGMTIFQYDASCNGAADYKALADEFAELYPQLVPPEPPKKSRHRTAPKAPATRPGAYNPASPMPILAVTANLPHAPTPAESGADRQPNCAMTTAIVPPPRPATRTRQAHPNAAMAPTIVPPSAGAARS
jgi:chromosome partitioning protein